MLDNYPQYGKDHDGSVFAVVHPKLCVQISEYNFNGQGAKTLRLISRSVVIKFEKRLGRGLAISREEFYATATEILSKELRLISEYDTKANGGTPVAPLEHIRQIPTLDYMMQRREF